MGADPEGTGDQPREESQALLTLAARSSRAPSAVPWISSPLLAASLSQSLPLLPAFQPNRLQGPREVNPSPPSTTLDPLLPSYLWVQWLLLPLRRCLCTSPAGKAPGPIKPRVKGVADPVEPSSTPRLPPAVSLSLTLPLEPCSHTKHQKA